MSISKQLAADIRSAARADAVDYAPIAKAVVALAKADQPAARVLYLSAFIGKRLGVTDSKAIPVITMSEHGKPVAGKAERDFNQQSAFGAAKTSFSRFLSKAGVKSEGKNTGNKSRTNGKANAAAAAAAVSKAAADKAAAKVAPKVGNVTELHAKFEVIRAGLIAMLNVNAKLKGIAPYRAIVADFGKALDTIPADGE